MDHKTRRAMGFVLGLGVGLGLILAAIVLAFQPAKRLTDAEVRDRAKALGMVDPTQLQGAAKAPAEPPKPAPEPAPAPKPAVTFLVSEGMGFYALADLLKAAGVITDWDGFVQRAQEREVMDAVKPGIYTIPLGETPDSVLDRLIRTAS